ncbi:methyl-accepting chemotaxis protein [Clostridium nigeriense]|uniref:methyl-accepting chemotaxis protein n=1 Tax=Clostridium nigeriense TaxID=1805470 RepID=UPI00082BF992|nr:methyl-accepting chemotaxis protein [Clostridium nigeriense]
MSKKDKRKKLKKLGVRRLTITQKILLFITAIILITSLTLASYYSYITYKNETKRVNEVLEQTRDFGESLTDDGVVEIEQLILSIQTGIKDKERANNFVYSLSKSNPYVTSIATKGENNDFISYSGSLSKSYVEKLTFSKGIEDGVFWSNFIKSGDIGYIVIKASKNGVDCFIQLSMDYFQNKMDSFKIEGIELDLTDSFGMVMASNNVEKINTKINDEFNKIMSNDKGVGEVTVGSSKKIVTYHKANNDFKVAAIYDKASLNKTILNSILFNFLITIGVALVVLLGSYVIVKKYLSAIIDINKMSKSMGERDFTYRSNIKLNNELGDALAELNNSFEILKSVFTENIDLSLTLNENTVNIAEASNSIYEASKQVSTSIENINSVTQQQADSMVNISNNINILGDSIKNVGNSIKILKDLYSTLRANAKKNNTGMKNLLNDNLELQNSIEYLSKDILEISSSTKKINDFVSIIDDIANSINLISINASIEAAHAGEVGKGFAVVAKEINNLAENSKEATELIKGTTKDIRSKINSTIEILNETKEVSLKESRSVADTVDSLKIMRNEIDIMKDAIDSIVNSNEVVNSKREEILIIVENSAAAMEEVAASTEEISALTEDELNSMEGIKNMASDLRKLSEKMKENIIEFKV